MRLSHSALVAIISTSGISSCAACVLLLTVGLVCVKLKSVSNGRAMADAVLNFEMNEPSPAHVYEAIVPNNNKSGSRTDEEECCLWSSIRSLQVNGVLCVIYYLVIDNTNLCSD